MARPIRIVCGLKLNDLAALAGVKEYAPVTLMEYERVQ
jgi:hypothetical protein